MGNDFDLTLVRFSYSRYLPAQAMNETLHEADMSIYDAGLQVLDGVFAKGRTRRSQIYAVEAGRSTGECLGGGEEAGGEGTTPENTLRGDDIEGGGRAGGDDKGRTTTEVMRGPGCGDTIRAQSPPVIDAQ